MLKELTKFLMRGNIIDLAAGVIIGSAFNKIVDALVTQIIMPVIGILTGGINLEGMEFTLYGDAKLGWGAVLQSILHFIIIGSVLYFMLRGYNKVASRLKKQEAEAPPPPPTHTESMLSDIRDIMTRVEENTRR
jgi:large conductance mechanosensitive channel